MLEIVIVILLITFIYFMTN